MKHLFKIGGAVFLAFLLMACENDDDVCVQGEGTPQLKLKFRTQATGKLRTLDSLYLNVDYGNGPVKVVQKANVDSVFIPLRVDQNSFTDFWVKETKYGDSSLIRVNYTTKSIYVSPACGMKRNYENVTYQLLNAQPVVELMPELNEITNESKTHLYLLF